MKRTANVATYPGREKALALMLESIKGQFDEIRIVINHPNEYGDVYLQPGETVFIHRAKEDMADNGKFYWLDFVLDDEIYFTLDDDLRYPSDYVEKTIEALNTFGCIVSWHGRALAGKGYNYYKGSVQYPCLGTVHESLAVDVGGTGVMAFDTRYFHPKGLAASKDLRMSDMVLALEAAKQGKQIGVIKHEAGWIKYLGKEGKIRETIYETESRKGCLRQNEIADEIWDLRYGQV